MGSPKCPALRRLATVQVSGVTNCPTTKLTIRRVSSTECAADTWRSAPLRVSVAVLRAEWKKSAWALQPLVKGASEGPRAIK